MRLSNRFKELKKRLSELRINLLPKTFSPTGDYTGRQQDRARGYRLLVHAEIESYLEDISKETITEAIKKWKKSKKPSTIIVSFLASYHSSWSTTEEIKNEEIIKIAKSRKDIQDSVNEIIDLAQRQFINRLKKNHGIKEKNFNSLILPTGADIGNLDSTWLTNLNAFGENRGEVAHNSKRTQKEINPKDEFNAVRTLLEGIEKLDRELSRVREKTV